MNWVGLIDVGYEYNKDNLTYFGKINNIDDTYYQRLQTVIIKQVVHLL